MIKHFNRLLSRINRCCVKMPKRKHSPANVKIWSNLKWCVKISIHDLQTEMTTDYTMFVNSESQCQPSGLTYKEIEEVEKQELLHWLLCDVKNEVKTLRSFQAMMTAMELCQQSHDECVQQNHINQAVTSIVKELVALVEIFYKCQFSVAELRKMPTATFTQYQKHLNVFSEWFKRRCVL